MNKKLIVFCPKCKKSFNYYALESRPFCSDKCRLIDLGQWLSEAHSVPGEVLLEIDQETFETGAFGEGEAPEFYLN